MDWKRGQIIYCKPFYFTNGGEPKNKYCLILSTDSDDDLLICLLTKRVKVPPEMNIDKGCIINEEDRVGGYKISKNDIVTDCNKKMKLDTFAYTVEFYSKDLFDNNYCRKDDNYEVFGMMREDLFQGLIKCLGASPNIPKFYKRILNKL